MGDHHHGVYGAPPAELATADPAAMQLSPLAPGAAALEDCAPGALAGFTMLAPPGAIERRYAIALALRALAPGAPLTVLAPKDRGGSRLRGELEAFGCEIEETSRRHHRVCLTRRPADGGREDVLAAAIAEGAPRLIEPLGVWSQPGVFSWDRIDPGSALLIRSMPPLIGEGADLGCGVGVLARAVLANAKVRRLVMIDNDRRAIEAARRNVQDPRAEIVWADATGADVAMENLDFVVMNPPFHDGGAEDRDLGRRFIQRARQVLRRSGTCWMVANRHLPYEALLSSIFASVERRADSGGYKVFEARR